jgi:hypothetical protein
LHSTNKKVNQTDKQNIQDFKKINLKFKIESQIRDHSKYFLVIELKFYKRQTLDKNKSVKKKINNLTTLVSSAPLL